MTPCPASVSEATKHASESSDVQSTATSAQQDGPDSALSFVAQTESNSLVAGLNHVAKLADPGKDKSNESSQLSTPLKDDDTTELERKSVQRAPKLDIATLQVIKAKSPKAGGTYYKSMTKAKTPRFIPPAVDRSKPYGHMENPQIIPSTPQPGRFAIPMIKKEPEDDTAGPGVSGNQLSHSSERQGKKKKTTKQRCWEGEIYSFAKRCSFVVAKLYAAYHCEPRSE